MKTNSRMTRRILSILLTLLMVLSLVPLSVFSTLAAADPAPFAPMRLENYVNENDAIFANGKLAYLLQQGVQNEELWGQTIGTDAHPVLGGKKVYQTESCSGQVSYSNTAQTAAHDYTNGFCTSCGSTEPAEYNEETGVYEISNAGQLYWFTDKVNNDNENFGSADAILTSDIVVNEGTVTANSTNARIWTPIGKRTCQYTGTFNGDGHTVSGLYYNSSASGYVGLFGFVGKEGTIKNTAIIGSYLNGYDYVGGVAGYSEGTITNCYSQCKVIGTNLIGGVAGYSSGSITNCRNNGDVNGSNSWAGGVAACNNGSITNCYNTGKVNGYGYAGGVVGFNEGATITNCYNTGDVSGFGGIGGVAGDNSGEISNCYNTGNVSGTVETGGVLGTRNIGTVTNCYYKDTAYSGGISIEGSSDAEDIAGSAEAKTAAQFASGEVAYLLGDAFGQAIGTDQLPTLGGNKVYLVENCNGDPAYNNTAENTGHNFVDGKCTVCGTADPETKDELKGYTIALGDKIAVNYFMSLTEKTLKDTKAKMVFTVPDTGSTYTVEIPVSEAVKNSDYYVFTCEVAAKEITSAIKAQLVTSDSESDVFEYSVKQYAEYILGEAQKAQQNAGGIVGGGVSNTVTSAQAAYIKAAPLVKAMLNYGAYAQVYFGYNTENLANDSQYMTAADKALPEELDLSTYACSTEGTQAGVTYYGSALSLESETAIKLYFIVEDDATVPDVTVNGKQAELTKNGNIYELKISAVPAHLIGEMYEVKVGSLTLSYGALSYGHLALGSDKTALKDTVKALYAYYEAAVSYIG